MSRPCIADIMTVLVAGELQCVAGLLLDISVCLDDLLTNLLSFIRCIDLT